MFFQVLFVLFLLFLLFLKRENLGLVWKGRVRTVRGLIQIPFGGFGFSVVQRSPKEISLYLLTSRGIKFLKLKRVIPPADIQIYYLINDERLPCPYEIGPPLILPEGELEVRRKVKSILGLRESILQTSTWP